MNRFGALGWMGVAFIVGYAFGVFKTVKSTDVMEFVRLKHQWGYMGDDNSAHVIEPGGDSDTRYRDEWDWEDEN